MYKFEKLKVWKESIELSRLCCELTKTFPAYEKSGLSDQLRRAVTSISLNIAEGSGSDSDKDFRRLLLLARKSLYEVVAILKIAERIHKVRNLKTIYNKINLVGKLLNGLIKHPQARRPGFFTSFCFVSCLFHPQVRRLVVFASRDINKLEA